MKVHMIEFGPKDVLCKGKSWLLESTSNPKLVTCKACRELHEINIGKRDYMSFGGSLDKFGKVRKNRGSGRWPKNKKEA